MRADEIQQPIVIQNRLTAYRAAIARPQRSSRREQLMRALNPQRKRLAQTRGGVFCFVHAKLSCISRL